MRHTLTTALGLVSGTMLFAAAPAAAQNTQTWVSSAGSDAAACSRAAPCATFTAALAVTNSGGQINCVDRANYSAVTINKGVTIECNIGSVVVSSGAGITVAAGASDVVTIRGLQIDGAGASSGNGITVTTAGKLILDGVAVRNFIGSGISFAPNSNSQLFLIDTSVSNNSNAAAAILVQPSASITATLSLTRANVSGNAGSAIRAKTAAMTAGGVVIKIYDSTLAGNNSGVLAQAGPGTAPAVITISDSEVVRNASYGVAASGPLAQILVASSAISGNGYGVVRAGGTVISDGFNLVTGNTTDGGFSATIAQQ